MPDTHLRSDGDVTAGYLPQARLVHVHLILGRAEWQLHTSATGVMQQPWGFPAGRCKVGEISRGALNHSMEGNVEHNAQCTMQ